MEESINTLPATQPSTPSGTPSATPQGMSYDTKVTITVVSLLLFYPLGILLMWLWMKWKMWVKIVLSVLLVLPVLLAVPAVILLTSIDPVEQFAKASNTKRRTDVNMIMTAIKLYKADNEGLLPANISTAPLEIRTSGVDLCTALVPEYMAALPADLDSNNGEAISDCTVPYETGYEVFVDDQGKLTVRAKEAELDTPISVTE